MFGTVKMPDGTIATLEDDGYWTHPENAVQSKLNSDHSLHGEKFVSMSLPKMWIVATAAEAFGGEAIEPPELIDEDED